MKYLNKHRIINCIYPYVSKSQERCRTIAIKNNKVLCATEHFVISLFLKEEILETGNYYMDKQKQIIREKEDNLKLKFEKIEQLIMGEHSEIGIEGSYNTKYMAISNNLLTKLCGAKHLNKAKLLTNKQKMLIMYTENSLLILQVYIMPIRN